VITTDAIANLALAWLRSRKLRLAGDTTLTSEQEADAIDDLADVLQDAGLCRPAAKTKEISPTTLSAALEASRHL